MDSDNPNPSIGGHTPQGQSQHSPSEPNSSKRESVETIITKSSDQYHVVLAKDISTEPINIVDMIPLRQESSSLATGTAHIIPPFSLLGPNVDVKSLLQEYGINPASVDDIFPCTPLQEAFISLSSKELGGYVRQDIYDLSPNLDISAFRNAWETVVRNTPVLRTRILLHSDTMRFLQVVLKNEIHWDEATGIDIYLRADKERSMTDGQPLVHYGLIKSESGVYESFVWTIHHALYDGWSRRCIRTLISQVYLGLAPTISAPRFQSFIKHIEETDQAESNDFWRKTLANCESDVFPFVPSSLRVAADTLVEHQISFPRLKSNAIRRSTFIHAAWALVIGCITNTTDIVFGATLSGRKVPIANIAELIAPTIATVPIRCTWSKGQKVREFLETLQQHVELLISYEQAGLSYIAKLSPDCQRACMFNNMVVIQPDKEKETNDILWKLQGDQELHQFNSYPLMLELELSTEEITCQASFDSHIMAPELVRKLLSCLDSVLQQFTRADHDMTLAEVSWPEAACFAGYFASGKRQSMNSLPLILETNKSKIVNYWCRTMADCAATHFPLPSSSKDHPKPSAAREIVAVDFPFSQQRSSSVTTSAMFRAAWALIVSAATDSDDVVFGVTVSRRKAPVEDISEMTGPTLGTVPMRIHPDSKERSLFSYLDEVQQQSTQMIPYEQSGLHNIAKLSASCQHACGFRTLLLIQPLDGIPEKTESLGRWHDIHRQLEPDTYPLIIELNPGADSMRAEAYFDPSAISSIMAKRLLQRLGWVMHQFDRAASHTLVSDINIVTTQDLDEMWENNATVPAAVEECVHTIIEDQARNRPQAIAVSAWDGEITYAKLDQFATIVARHFVTLGISKIIPLCFEKSMWTTVAMLATLKAGAGFILLDASLPKLRLQSVLQQLDTNIIVASPANTELCATLVDTVITFDANFCELLITRDDPGEILPISEPSSVLYVVFTSGSTGVPKGVLVSHRNVATAIHYQAERLGYTCDSRVYDFASYSFDVHITNVLTTLATGGCLCVPQDSDRKARLQQNLINFRVNLVDLTPSVAQVLNPEEMPDLKTIIFGGEAVNVRDILPWWGKARVLNTYGPSECTSCSTINDSMESLERTTDLGDGVGLLTWVVDPKNHNFLSPPGCIGELLLEGPLVGDGYLNDPVKTSAAFIQDPVWLVSGTPTIPGRRGCLYKTGDLVRWDERGLIFLGRKDIQIKLRGQRIELGEVEHRVAECLPGISQVVVDVINPNTDGSSSVLVAFIRSPDANTEMEITAVPVDVEMKLSALLPRYMVPTFFIRIKEFPMTVTGKSNRKKLGEMGASISAKHLAEAHAKTRKITRRMPTSKVEKQIHQIWSRALKLAPSLVGLDDSFFQLGGDSILCMKVAVEAYKLGLQISIVDMFHNPTLEDIAKRATLVVTSPTIEIPPVSLTGEKVDAASHIKKISTR